MHRSFGFVLLLLWTASAMGADWTQFRGPDGASVAANVSLPTKLGDAQHTVWKTKLPGRGPSSPIVVGDRVFVTCSDGVRQDRLIVLCFDAGTGKQRWRRHFWATGRTLSHPVSANAAPSPASDGQRVFAFFSSNDLVCLDLDGNLQWYRGLAHDFPKAGNDVGMSASPIVARGTVVVQIENYGDSFAAGLDVATGETRWRIERSAKPNWCSPTVLRGADGKEVVLLQSPTVLTAHDPVTGQQVWQYEAACNAIPSAVGTNGRVFLPAGGMTMLDLSDSAPKLAWNTNKLSPGGASPIVDGDRLYVLNNVGVLTCADAATGDNIWQIRIGGTHWSTPVIAGGHMYCFSQEGKARVVSLGGQKGELVSESDFGEMIQSSPAVAGNALYLRGEHHLWKIADK